MRLYKDIAQKFFIPSLFILLFISTIILFSYSLLLDGYGLPAGFISGILTLVSFPLVYWNAMRMEQGHGRRFSTGNACRVAVLAAISFFIAAVVVIRIRGFGLEKKPLPRSTYFAYVERVVERRYDQEAVLRFRGADMGRDGSGSCQRDEWHDGIAYVSGATKLHSGSEVTFEGKPMFMENGSTVSPFHRSLSCRGIRYVFYLKSESLSVVTSGTDMRDVARDRLSASCDALFNRQTSSVVKALYFGNQNYIDKSILNDFKRAGVLHVLSASGLHVGVVAAVPLFALGLLRLNRKYVLTVSALVVVLYLYVTDMPVSLLRASIMFLMYALYRMVDREANIINTLFLSALVILVLFPYEIYSLGFQLSFGATLGILLLFRLYRNTFAYLPGRISDSLALTVAAQVPVIPVLFARVGEVNVTCVMSNLIVVPAMSLLLVVSLVANGLFALTSHAAYIGHCADALFAASTYIIGFISGLGGHFKVAAVHPVLIAAFGMILLPLFPGLSRKKIMSLSIVSGFVIACLFFAISPARDEGARVITHGRGSTLLVKQGDSLSVIGSLPERSQIGLVMREIDKISFRTILIYIPGPDYRNISGYSYLIKRIPVRRCYLSDKFPLKKYMKKFFLLLEGDGVELVLHDFQSRCGAAGTSPQVAAAGSEPERIFARYRALVK